MRGDGARRKAGRIVAVDAILTATRRNIRIFPSDIVSPDAQSNYTDVSPIYKYY